ncbi:MAG: CMD domain protein [Chloroflexota bacterium]|nr:CMD domain protein [Chloroflexota bacterium]
MTAINVQTTDVVNAILGIDEDSPIARLRNQKPDLVRELQDYYLSIFEPTVSSAEAFPVLDRYLVAIRVASHTGSIAVADWYGRLAIDAGAPPDALDRTRNIETPATGETLFGAALRHADLLTTRPADARQDDLRALKDAEFSPAGIVSLSQTIAFVSYQLRLIAGLRALGGRS